MTVLVPTLKRRKKDIPSFGWKFVSALVGNYCIIAPYKLDMASWSRIGGSTILEVSKMFFPHMAGLLSILGIKLQKICNPNISYLLHGKKFALTHTAHESLK